MNAVMAYRAEKAKRRSYYLTDSVQHRTFDAQPMPVPRMERNAEWVRWYAKGMSTTDIAIKWEHDHGEKCYAELVRRTLRAIGVEMRPRGWVSTNKKRHALAARVAVLERQVEKLLAGAA